MFSVNSNGPMVCSKNVEIKYAAVIRDTSKIHSKLFHVRDLIYASNFRDAFLRLTCHKNLALFISN